MAPDLRTDGEVGGGALSSLVAPDLRTDGEVGGGALSQPSDRSEGVLYPVYSSESKMIDQPVDCGGLNGAPSQHTEDRMVLVHGARGRAD